MAEVTCDVRALDATLADVLYALVTALIVGVGAVLELRRMRAEDKRASPEVDVRLARIEAADPVREAMARLGAM